MNLQLKKVVVEKLELLHSTNPTLKVLYDAIESCCNEQFVYHRDIVFDMFNDNENLIEDIEGKLFYSFTDVRFEKDVEKTNLDELLEGLNSHDGFPNFVLDNEKELKEVNEWVEIYYKRFVLFFFTLCLKRLDVLNETIEQY